MKIAVITANLGSFDPNVDYVEQSVPYDFYKFTDENFPPRHRAMTPRMQARIVKMFGWQMVPRHDFYIWVDSSCILSHKDSIRWFLKQCEGVDMAVFKHPDRNSIQEEADFLKERLNRGDSYIVSRYENELIDEQLDVIKSDKSYADQNLYASTALIYRNNSKVQNVMHHWWHHTSRYHIIDQLSLPYVLYKQNCTVRIIPDSYLKVPYLKHIRNTKYLNELESTPQESVKTSPALDVAVKKAVVTTEVQKAEPKEIIKVDEVVVQKESKEVLKTVPSKQDQKKPQEKSKKDVLCSTQRTLDFWKEWLVGNGRAFENPRWLLNMLAFTFDGKDEVTIANIGAGPMNMIGNGKRGKKMRVIASDSLADEFSKMRKELDINPVNPVEKQDMENLTYEDGKFDVVYSDNALNYMDDPYKVLQEMLRVCKPGGYIYLRHNVYEGSGGRPLGIPKWKVDTTESGSCIFKNVHAGSQRSSFALSDIFPGFVTEIEELPKGRLITSFVKKV